MKHPVRNLLIAVAAIVLFLAIRPLACAMMPTGGLVFTYRAFGTYEELATDYADPVFEAFANSDEAERHSVEYATLRIRGDWTKDVIARVFVVLDSLEKIDREYTAEELSYDPIGSAIGMAPTTIYFHSLDDAFSESDNQWFSNADDMGVRSDYDVDGITVQKFLEKDFYVLELEQEIARHDEYEQAYREDLDNVKTSDAFDWWERVSIDGMWYYVRSDDEATADAVATALAHIAAGM